MSGNARDNAAMNGMVDDQMRAINVNPLGRSLAGIAAFLPDFAAQDAAEAIRKKKHGTYKPVDPFAKPNKPGLKNLARNIFIGSE